MFPWIQKHYTFVKRTAVVTGVILAAVFCLFFGFSNIVSAQSVAEEASPLNIGVQVIEQPLGLPVTDIRLIIARIIRAALGLVGIVLVVLIMYGGWLWMTAGGNEEQIGQAKKVITNAVIGLIIILSAYGIVSFIIKLLGVPSEEGGPGIGPPGTQNFQGSGALGGIIKDHYPMRDQVDVPRNTKIAITFRKPVKVDSFVQNSNQSKDGQGNEIFGDCVNIGANMDWKTDYCDALIMDESHINITRTDNSQKISGAAVLASYEQGKAYTIVIRPYDNLGSNTDKIPYKVHLGDSILLDDSANGNPSAFQTKVLGNNYYEWQFTCDTVLDNTPPHVNSVFPADKSTEARNTVIQIDFSEPMDPTGIQGQFTAEGGIFYLDGKNIFLKTAHSTIPLGNFRLVNGYRTLEFTSTVECGRNACGGKIYCLPVCDAPGAACQEDNYEMLLRAAQTFSSNSFESIPFSGLMDLCGNALDSDKDGKVDFVSSTVPVFPDQEKPDNYFWGFIMKNELDTTPPYLQKVVPGLDAEFIAAKDDWTMLFSKRMRVEPMYDIGIEQQPPQPIPLCKTPRVWFNTDGTALTSMSHCPFLDELREYYYPLLNSGLEDVHFNCFYPGQGPGGNAEVNKRLKESSLCDDQHPENCCAVKITPENQSFCCNGVVDTGRSTQDNCLKFLKSVSL